MGFKKTAAFVVTVCMLMQPLVVNAESVDKLYEKYDIDYEVVIPQNVTETLKNYNAAQRYVKMYHYVASSIFDKTEIQSELSEKEKELKTIEKQLRGGYNKTIVEIYELENKYLELSDDVNRLQSSLKDYQPDWGSEVAENVPDYSGYIEAKKIKDEIVSSKEIGLVTEAKVPVASKALLLDNSDTYTVYKTISGTGVNAMFNGKVEAIEEDPDYGLTITVNSNNDVYYYICNLHEATVKVGDTVYQGQNVGYIMDTQAVFRLKLNGTFVDVSRLYSKEN